MRRTAYERSLLSPRPKGRLKPGQQVAATGKHPANVLITAMNAVGVAGNLGEVTGAIPQLLV